MEEVTRHQYVENPYVRREPVPEPVQPVKREREVKMGTVRSSFVLSLALFICVGMSLYYLYSKDQYEIMAAGQGLYVFDHRTLTFSYCDDKECKLIGFQGENPFQASRGFMSFGQKNVEPGGFSSPARARPAAQNVPARKQQPAMQQPMMQHPAMQQAMMPQQAPQPQGMMPQPNAYMPQQQAYTPQQSFPQPAQNQAFAYQQALQQQQAQQLATQQQQASLQQAAALKAAAAREEEPAETAAATEH